MDSLGMNATEGKTALEVVTVTGPRLLPSDTDRHIRQCVEIHVMPYAGSIEILLLCMTTQNINMIVIKSIMLCTMPSQKSLPLNTQCKLRLRVKSDERQFVSRVF